MSIASAGALTSRSPCGGFVDHNRDLSACAATGQMLDRVAGPVEWIGGVERGRDDPTLDEIAEAFEVRLTLTVDDEREPLAHEGRQSPGLQLAAHSGYRVTAFATDDDECAARPEHGAKRWNWGVPARVDDGVIGPVAAVGARIAVIGDHAVRSERANEVR